MQAFSRCAHLRTSKLELAAQRDAKQIPKRGPGRQNWGSGTTAGKLGPTVWDGTGGAQRSNHTMTSKEGVLEKPLNAWERSPSRCEMLGSATGDVRSRSCASMYSSRFWLVPLLQRWETPSLVDERRRGPFLHLKTRAQPRSVLMSNLHAMGFGEENSGMRMINAVRRQTAPPARIARPADCAVLDRSVAMPS